MAQDFFRVYRGIELDDTIQILTGSGNPGVSQDTVNAPIGSTYTDTLTGNLWTKAASGAEGWKLQATQNYVQTMLATGVSWREPVKVADAVSTTVPAGSAGNTVVVDGETIDDGQRVLLAGLTTDANVYVYDKTTGVFVQDANVASDGDTVFSQEGTDADSTWQFNGTKWNIITTSTTNSELGYLRNYVGKQSAGSALPTYTGTGGIVANNDTLTAAVSKLDSEAGSVNAFVGKTDDNLPTYSSTTVVSNNDTLVVAVGKLDSGIDGLHDDLDALASDTLQVDGAGVTTLSDSVVAVAAEWDVFVQNASTTSKVWAGKVFATQNGTDADYTVFGVLKLNGSVPVSASASFTSGQLVLTVSTGSTSSNVRIKRVSVIK
jgi:hypothetical protein